MDVPERHLGEARVYLLGAVSGLVAEGDRVREAVEAIEPDRVAVGIAPAELEGLRAGIQDEIDEEIAPEISDVDEAYARHLARYGRVQLPPPSFVGAVEAAIDAGLPTEALDMGEHAYTDLFTEEVGVIDLIRKSRREKRLAKRGVEADSAEEFAKRWDDSLLKVGGLQTVETRRERHMADRLRDLCEAPGTVLAVVESVRCPGIRERLWPTESEGGKRGLFTV